MSIQYTFKSVPYTLEGFPRRSSQGWCQPHSIPLHVFVWVCSTEVKFHSSITMHLNTLTNTHSHTGTHTYTSEVTWSPTITSQSLSLLNGVEWIPWIPRPLISEAPPIRTSRVVLALVLTSWSRMIVTGGASASASRSRVQKTRGDLARMRGVG